MKQLIITTAIAIGFCACSSAQKTTKASNQMPDTATVESVTAAAASPQTSETTILKGSVTDLKEFKPLPKVEVSLRTFDDKWEKKSVTDSRGNFVIKDVPPGTYKICYEKKGFENGVCQSITILAGQVKNIGLTMYGR